MQALKPGSDHLFVEQLLDFDGNPAVPTKPGYAIIENAAGLQLFRGDILQQLTEDDQPSGFFELAWTVPVTEPSNPHRIRWFVPTAEGLITHGSSFEIESVPVEDFSFVDFVSEGFTQLRVQAPSVGEFSFSLLDDHQRVKFVKAVTVGPDLHAVVEHEMLAKLKPGEYLYMLEGGSEPIVGNLHVASLRFWQMLPRLRTHLDRARYPLVNIKAYQDHHIYSWFVDGLALINSKEPITPYSWHDFPRAPRDHGLETYWIKAAALHALRSQLLLENELAFSYSGVNVDVDYDRTPGIEAEIGRLEAELDEPLAKLKEEIWRRGPIGVIAHRAVGAASYGRRRTTYGR